MEILFGDYFIKVMKILSNKFKESNQASNIYQSSLLWRTARASELPSPKYRRYRGDMITTYNIIQDNLDLDRSLFFTSSWSNTRGHPYKLFKPFYANTVKQHFFLKELLMTVMHFLPMLWGQDQLMSLKATLEKYK